MEARELIHSYIGAWERRDFGTFQRIFSEAVTYWDPLVERPLQLGGMAQYVGQLLAAFPDLKFEVKFLGAGADFGTFEWVMRGRNSAPSSLHPASNRDLALPGADVIRVADGKIRAINAYFDRATYLEQLGLAAVQSPNFA